MISVLLWELKRRRWFMLWWALGVSLLVGVTNISYLAIDEQAQQLDDAFAGLTESAGGFFGGTDFFSPVGYLSSQVYYILLPLLLIIMISTLVSSLMAKDENDTTVELTLARPLSRYRLLLAKALAALGVTVVVGFVSYTVAVVTVFAADIDINQGYLALTHALSFAFAASFGVISFTLIAASRVTRKFATVAAIVISFGGYIIDSLAGFVSQLEGVAKAMPYHYYDTAEMLTGTVDKGLIIYLVGVLLVGIIVSVIGYGRRDIG